MSLLLSAANYQQNVEYLERAFDIAQSIEDNEVKSAALLDMLDEVEVQLGTDEVSEEPAEEQPPENNDNQES